MTVLDLPRELGPTRQARAVVSRTGDPVSLALLLAMALCVSGSINDVGWAEGTGFLILHSAVAVLLAYSLERSRLRPWVATAIGVLAGMLLILVTVGGLWPPLAYVRADLSGLQTWWQSLLAQGWQALSWPFPESGAYLYRQVSAIIWRTWVWGWRVYLGRVSSDRQVWLLVVSVVLYLVTFTSSWQLLRHWRASLAVLLLGIAQGANSFMAGQEPTWALAFIGLGLVLLARGSARGLEAGWLSHGTDYSEELLPYATVIGLGLAALAVVVSPLLPLLTSRTTYEAFWRVFREPWSQVEDTTGRWFQGLDSPSRQSALGSGEGGLEDPSAGHSVGATAAQGNQVVMRVRTSDPAPEPWAGGVEELEAGVLVQRHWRAATYDTYTGAGWVNSGRETVAVDADAELPVEDAEARKEFVQAIQRRGASQVVYAAGQPYRVDQSLQLTIRSSGDLISLSGRDSLYEVVSLVPDVTISGLQAAGEDYPAEIAERYLALPEVPQRLRQLTAEVVAQAETPYAKARAIESYLRQFAYDPDVPQVPVNRDAVDYLIFDLQRGFCDHFSTAMTVMLRLSGVPARVAVGYARGTYDHDDGNWVVTEADSHAWVEAYFPGYGWVEFEPTPSEDVYVYAHGDSWEGGSAALPEPPATGSGWRLKIDIGTLRLVAGACLAAYALVRLLAWALRRRVERPEDRIAQAYGTVARSGAWIGLTPGPTETVRDYWQRLQQALSDEAIFVSTPWGTEWVWQFERVSAPLRYVLAAHERSLFGPEPLGPAIARRATQEAARLRREFALLWLARRLGE